MILFVPERPFLEQRSCSWDWWGIAAWAASLALVGGLIAIVWLGGYHCGRADQAAEMRAEMSEAQP